ncbi:hypothetical protein IJJ39_02580 [Candidatus Saccharibacteria bacterium]|nr:hypothetical protein [Candidatus Saccharibacteria bacterium]
MKANKKAIITTATAVSAVALAAGGTIAYFTDHTDPITNSFTVGDVKIEIYESQLHRENSGIQGTVGALAGDPTYCDYTKVYSGVNYNRTGNALAEMLTYGGMRYCTPNTNADNTVGISAVDNGHTRTGFNNANRTWGYSDATIIEDAATYKNSIAGGDATDGYFTTVSEGIVPGQWIRKFTYVKNTDNENADYSGSDAYVLIRYMVPTSYADDLDLKIPGTPYEEDTNATEGGIQAYFTAVNRDNVSGEYSAYALTEHGIDDYTGYTQTIDGVEYQVYAAVTTLPINPGEMTFWSPVNTIRLKTDRQNSDPTAADYVAPDAIREVVVDAQAIQAKTFSNAVEAINNL